MLVLHIEAPFGASREFGSGKFIKTMDFIAPSVFYGLLLNVASIDMRDHQGSATLIKSGLPKFKMAIGVIQRPWKQSLFQQLHTVLVGADDPTRKALAKSNKNHIATYNREFLADVKAYVAISGNDELIEDIRKGLRGEIPRFGLPFLGDSDFFLQRMDVVEEAGEAEWICSLGDSETSDTAMRLTISVDRKYAANTKTSLFKLGERSDQIPESAWIDVGY